MCILICLPPLSSATPAFAVNSSSVSIHSNIVGGTCHSLYMAPSSLGASLLCFCLHLALAQDLAVLPPSQTPFSFFFNTGFLLIYGSHGRHGHCLFSNTACGHFQLQTRSELRLLRRSFHCFCLFAFFLPILLWYSFWFSFYVLYIPSSSCEFFHAISTGSILPVPASPVQKALSCCIQRLPLLPHSLLQCHHWSPACLLPSPPPLSHFVFPFPSMILLTSIFCIAMDSSSSPTPMDAWVAPMCTSFLHIMLATSCLPGFSFPCLPSVFWTIYRHLSLAALPIIIPGSLALMFCCCSSLSISTTFLLPPILYLCCSHGTL